MKSEYDEGYDDGYEMGAADAGEEGYKVGWNAGVDVVEGKLKHLLDIVKEMEV